MAEGGFGLIQMVILIAFVFHRAYYTRKVPAPEQDTLEEREEGLSQKVSNVMALPALIALAVYVIKPAWMAWSSIPFPVWARWVGVLLSAMGFGLLQWSHMALDRNWSDRPRITQTQTLTTHGPYQWVRHPIYLSFLMIFGSMILITSNWFVGGMWLLITAIDVRSRIRFEEARLDAHFPEAYRAYQRSTGSLFPRIH